MPASKDITKYPIAFQRIISMIDVLEEPITLDFASVKEANRFRAQWYNYLRALEHKMVRTTDMEAQEIAGQLEAARRTSWSVRKNLPGRVEEATLIVEPLEQTAMAVYADDLADSLEALHRKKYPLPVGGESQEMDVEDAAKRVLEQMAAENFQGDQTD